MALSNPSPANGATGRSPDTVLSWTDSAASDYYHVYFGTDQTRVINGDTTVYRGIVTETEYDPRVSLTPDTTYYWRIEAVLDDVLTAGSLWSFGVIALPSGAVAGKAYNRKLWAIANNSFWYEDDSTPPNLVKLSGLVLDTAAKVSAVGAYGKVFIANGATKKVVDFRSTKLTCSALATPPEPAEEITQDQGGGNIAKMIVDYVNAAKTAVYGFTTSTTAFNTTDTVVTEGTNFTPSAVTEPTTPHYYDWTVFAGDSANYGAMPPAPTIVWLYQGRIGLAGSADKPHVWYLSRTERPHDWLYGSDDDLSAVAGTDTDVGKIGDVLTAAIPYADDHTIYGCTDSIWLQRGNPAAGMPLEQIAFNVGILTDTSWCWGPKSELYFMDGKGLYAILPGLSKPEPLTDNVLPDFVAELGLNPETQIVTLAHHPRRNMVLITVTERVDGSNANYWYDLRTQGFFPVDWPAEFGVCCQHYYNADEPEYRRTLMGCNDGHIRWFDGAAKNDIRWSGFHLHDMMGDVIAWWKLNDNAANKTVADSGPNGLDGTAGRNTEDFDGVGKVDGCLVFNGTSDAITVAHNASLNLGTSDFSVQFWVKTTSAVRQGIIRKRLDAAGFYIAVMEAAAGSKIGLFIYDSTVGTGVVPNAADVHDGDWHHVVVAVDRTNGLCQVWVDGVAGTAADISSVTGSINNTKSLFIGSQLVGDTVDFLDGSLDNLLIINRALTQAEVAVLYNGGDGTEDDALALPEAGTDQTAIDSHVTMGPIQMGADGYDGKLTRLTVVTAGGAAGGSQADTDAITVEMYQAETAEEIIEKVVAATSPFASLTLTGPGRGKPSRTRMRGAFAGIRLKNSTLSQTWALERVLAEVERAGRVR